MSVEQSQIVSLFKELYLFNTVEDAALDDVARKFEPVEYAPGEVIITQGMPGDYFYIIYEGRVRVSRKVGNVETPLVEIVGGDFFGEEALLSGRRRTASVVAVVSTTLLRLDQERLFALLRQYPQIKTSLARIIESHQFTRTHKFNWLREDEVIYQVRRKHEAYLLVALAVPGLLVLIALAFFLLGLASGPISPLATASYVVSGLVFLAGLAWGSWNWIDWGNDRYIVTDQRVVWIEQMIWLYDSRVEAPLTTLLSVNVTTSLLGRLLGYGDVVVRTFTGAIVLRTVGEPNQMAALVEEYWHRAQRKYKRAEEQEIEQSVRRAIGMEDKQSAGSQENPSAFKSEGYVEPSITQKYFGNIISMRVEQGNTITYRKHWIVLLKKTGWPILFFAVLVLVSLIYDMLFFMDRAQYIPPVLCNGVAILVALLALFPWWVYNYIDWRNDIYQVTDKNIFDIERKPLGTEVRKSASLENILSLEHRRLGFWGYLFNYGSVIINVGDAKFNFDAVYEPARIQQEIFGRMYELRKEKEKTDAARERERILALLATYHRNVEQLDRRVDLSD
ncbi:MAG: cyclic nucleotide-binding domain-containing protein [Anaerolineales bacterium]|nr:cyclic nucleotide-binding domain-containing protein [Anaerolineales bacterium]